ncbi:hypothetical protein N7450_009695 [Penicillium hetheringtonii]|uniref:Methyltransferase domain-containing protein n=1 Tax=Penicillium hetheringtonii TaxID=911720 RepID=A0AAD6DBI3_9EURO|nr:hypothetical protein N7450_009695 [Penicillium hetheringtonii]
MTDHTPTEAYSFDYYEELPADKERVWSLLKTYNHIPANEVERHLRDIREKGWKVFPYGCISHWIFLDCVITSSPEYSNILECLKPGGVLLDAGCAFGYQGFLDLGYDLFKDHDTFEDIIHAAALFHLFDWEDQVILGTRLVKFFKKDASKAMVVGRQIGTLYPRNRAIYKNEDVPGWYRHNLETWQDLWDEIHDKTGTKWKVNGTIREMQQSTQGSSGRAGLKFVINKV